MPSKYNGADAGAIWIREYQAKSEIPWCDMRRRGENIVIDNAWIDTHGVLALRMLDRLTIVYEAAASMYPGTDKSTPGYRIFREDFVDVVLTYITTIKLMMAERSNTRVN